MVIYFLLAFGLAFIPASVAGGKGRSGVLWYFYGLFLFPIAFFHALLMDDQSRPSVEPHYMQPVRDVPRVTGPNAGSQQIAAPLKECPRCAEMVQARAKICRFCSHEFAAVVDSLDTRPGEAPDYSKGWKFCAKCGHKNPLGEGICISCGHEFADVPPNTASNRAPSADPPDYTKGWKLCTKCGQKNPLGQVICLSCGDNMNYRPRVT